MRRRPAMGLAAAALAVAAPRAARADGAPIILFAAGSLREALGDIVAAFTRTTGRPVATAFGFSGLMRERIERDEPADLFASADLGHPRRLERDGRATQVVLFVRNALCVVGPAGGGLSPATLLDRLLDPAVPLGIFPPVQDPVGDYTMALFDRINAQRPGAASLLRNRARIITAAAGEDPVEAQLRDGRLGLHVSYCSTARGRLATAVPGLEIVGLPDALRVGPEYGLALLRDARLGTAELGLFILSAEGQRILAAHGFQPITLPETAA